METKKKSMDKRCIKTDKAIREAFAQLLAEKQLSQITVKELSEKALINRNTFYAHYESVYSLMDSIENEMVSDLMNVIDTMEEKEPVEHSEDAKWVFEWITQKIYTDYDYYRYLIQSTSQGHLLEKIKNATKSRLLDVLQKKYYLNREISDYMVEFCTAGMLAVYQCWFKSEHKYSPKRISTLIANAAFEGITSAIEMELDDLD